MKTSKTTPLELIGPTPISDFYEWELTEEHSLYLCRLRANDDEWGLQILINGAWKEGQYVEVFDSFESVRNKIITTDWSQYARV